MKKLLSILLAVVMIMAFAVPAMATGETESSDPTLSTHAYDLTYYVGGYGAVPGRFQCNVDYREQGYGYGDWFDISFGDPIVENWPTEAGTYTVTFEKTTAIEGAGDTEYTFSISMNITVLELPATSGKCGDNMNWSFDTTTDTLTISGTGDMWTIAETYEDVSNGNFSFEPGWWKLPAKHIVVEEGVENLSNYAFAQSWNNNYKLHETLQLPTSLEAIPEMGFMMGTAIKSLVIPEGITSLTGWPFGYPLNSFTALTDIYLPSTLTEMDYLSILVAGLGGTRTEGQTLKTIHYAGTEEQWNAVSRVDSECIKDIYGEGYDSFYENWCVPAKEIVEKLVVFEPKENVKEEVTVENGTATVPDSSVEITEGEDVVIDVTDTEEKVSSVVIGAETVDKLADAETAVEIKLPEATVSFDKTAIGSIGTQSGESAVTIVAKEVEDTALTTKQKAALEEKEVCAILNLEAFAGETKITEFGGGKVTVSVPFTLPGGKAGTDYYVAYVADDGTITAMPTAYANKMLTFVTNHFSSYVILEKTADPPAAGGAPATNGNPQTGDNGVWILMIALTAISITGMSVCIIKRNVVQ